MLPTGEGLAPLPLGAYHHLMAVIKAATATTASIIRLAISSVVGFSFLPFISSPPVYIIAYPTGYVNIFLQIFSNFFKKFQAPEGSRPLGLFWRKNYC